MGYRKSDEIGSYGARDPLEILKNKMVISGVITEIPLEKLAKRINDYIEKIFVRMLNQNQDFLAQFEVIK
jgi:TPP-dependent pyruvate/acetoin dehydrogenase alpha subunit